MESMIDLNKGERLEMEFSKMLQETGQKWQRDLKITEDCSIPVYGICGEETGKTLVITAGVHGCEYVGVQTARKLWKSLKCEEMKGQVIILPLVNAEGFYEGAKQIVPTDGKNLNRMFPGKRDGSLSEQIAYVIEKEIYPCADFLIDLHGGDCNEVMTPLVFFPVAAKESINAAAAEAAKCLPVNYCVRSTAKNGLYSYATQCDIPALLLEIGGEGKWKDSEVAQCERCVYHLMNHLEILNITEEVEAPKEIVQAVYDEAEVTGFWYPAVQRGQKVCKGDLLGEIRDLEDDVLQRVSAQLDGEVLYYTISLGIKKGEPLIAYGA